MKTKRSSDGFNLSTQNESPSIGSILPIFPEAKKNIDSSELGKVKIPAEPAKKTFTQVRISDDLIERLKDYCFENRVSSYAKMANEIIRNFLDKGGKVIKT